MSVFDSQTYTHDTPAGQYHNPITNQLEPSDWMHGLAAYEGGLLAPPNDVNEWQAVRQRVGPEVANAPFGLDSVTPFVGIGHYPVMGRT